MVTRVERRGAAAVPRRYGKYNCHSHPRSAALGFRTGPSVMDNVTTGRRRSSLKMITDDYILLSCFAALGFSYISTASGINPGILFYRCVRVGRIIPKCFRTSKSVGTTPSYIVFIHVTYFLFGTEKKRQKSSRAFLFSNVR